MRTTVDLDDDVLNVAKHLAEERRQSLVACYPTWLVTRSSRQLRSEFRGPHTGAPQKAGCPACYRANGEGSPQHPYLGFMAALLDVNALIALVDSDHVGHQAIRKWFTANHKLGWATCPLTENGMIRVLSQKAYPSGQRTPAEVIQVLNGLKTAFADTHHFWPDKISLADDSVFDGFLIPGARQVTDVYLLGLAAQQKGVFVSFDRGLLWHAVRGASARLVGHPG